MVTLNHDKVLLVVEQERDALCLMQALENSNRLALVWRAKDSAEAVFYLQGSGAYRNRDRYPQPDVIVTGLRGPAAAKVLRVAQGLTQCPLVVQLTATHDISQSLKSMSDGADCSQGKPNGRGETMAFVHWLEDWVEMLKSPGKQRTRMLFKVAGSLMTLSQQAMRAERATCKSKEKVFMKTPMITAYLRPTCLASQSVRAVLGKYELAFQERNVASDASSRSEMVRRSGQAFSPCVEVDGHMLPDVTGDDVEVYLLTSGLVKLTDARSDTPADSGSAVANVA